MMLSLYNVNKYHKQLWYVSYSTMLAITVPLTRTVGVTWTDDLIKHRLVKENKYFDGYRRVGVNFFLTYIYYHICYY